MYFFFVLNHISSVRFGSFSKLYLHHTYFDLIVQFVGRLKVIRHIDRPIGFTALRELLDEPIVADGYFVAEFRMHPLVNASISFGEPGTIAPPLYHSPNIERWHNPIVPHLLQAAQHMKHHRDLHPALLQLIVGLVEHNPHLIRERQIYVRLVDRYLVPLRHRHARNRAAQLLDRIARHQTVQALHVQRAQAARHHFHRLLAAAHEIRHAELLIKVRPYDEIDHNPVLDRFEDGRPHDIRKVHDRGQ